MRLFAHSQKRFLKPRYKHTVALLSVFCIQ